MNSTRGILCMVLSAVFLVSVPASAREKPAPELRRAAPVTQSLDQSAPERALRASAGTDTTWLASYTFNGGSTCVDEGWTSVDITQQSGPYFHVDDFAGLGGGERGLLVAPEGNQAMWCGARPSAEAPYCSYYSLPGYGNNWDQRFGTVDCLNVTGDVHITFLSTWDSEPGYDATCVEFDLCDDNWVNAPVFSQAYYFTCIDGWDADTLNVDIPDSLHSSTMRIRFRSQSDGAWSDEDGLWPGDGAIVIDSLSVTDDNGAVIPTELFETESVGDHTTASGNWTATIPPGYGDFAGLFPGTSVLQNEEDCNVSLSCLWGFFAGSTDDYSCAGYPGQAVVPYENERGQYINNEIWSPWIPISGSGERFDLAYDRYNDNPLDPMIFASWHVRSMVDDCPGSWDQDNFLIETFGGWERTVQRLDHLLDPAATHIQVALGVVDMCRLWCGLHGTGECHSHAPLYDNVTVYRIEQTGPMWTVQDMDLFQDTFAADGTTTGTARIDMARDILPSNNVNIRPGDSTVVRASHPSEGIAGDSYTGFGPAVYMYVSVWNGGARTYSGADLTDDTFRWPVVDSLSHGGNTWYLVRTDTSFTNGPLRDGIVPNAFCVDLDDDLFVPGDTICFAFGGTSGPPGSATTYWTPVTGETDFLADALDYPAECTILPAGGSILYVDGMNFRGSQPFFDTAFAALGISGNVDRYDIRAPAGDNGNRPGARVTNAAVQLASYDAVLWDTGNLNSGLIGDGTTAIEKSDDAGMLLGYLDALQAPGGVYFSGDEIADEWQYASGAAITLRNTYIEHTLVNGDHQGEGLPVSPYLVGTPGGCFTHLADPDTMVTQGGCPTLSRFDVLQPAGGSTAAMIYENDVNKGAVISQFTTNPDNATAGVFLSGVSFYSLRDDVPGDFDRAEHLGDILECLTGASYTVTDAAPADRFSLAQNIPNPFNPSTAITFTVRERAPVTLRVYNVRGQLVKTLVNDTRAPGITHHVEWDGRNDAGRQVASGVYFYRLVTKGFVQTRKMVVLK